jgi:hypothetical protein
LTARPLTAAELADLDGCDPGLEARVDAGDASTTRAEVAQEADDVDDLSYLRERLAAVFVELVNRLQVLQGEAHAVIAPRLGHKSTMAGRL